jgi:hypothetical protein
MAIQKKIISDADAKKYWEETGRKDMAAFGVKPGRGLGVLDDGFHSGTSSWDELSEYSKEGVKLFLRRGPRKLTDPI